MPHPTLQTTRRASRALLVAGIVGAFVWLAVLPVRTVDVALPDPTVSSVQDYVFEVGELPVTLAEVMARPLQGGAPSPPTAAFSHDDGQQAASPVRPLSEVRALGPARHLLGHVFRC